ncbi:hypothetical protein [Tolypothrix sp. NIES-4075]|nr:hypothetical protein [Tolypothrix sp. NIES-4075]
MGIWDDRYQNVELPWLRWWDDRANVLLSVLGKYATFGSAR